MTKILLLIALTVASIWSSESSRAEAWRSERVELQQDCRLPSPQRGRRAGGEGDHHNLIGRLPFGIQQASSAFVSPPRATFPQRQLLSTARERQAVAFSVPQQLQAASRRLEGFLPGARVLLDAHNCYPENGQWGDRLQRALKTGFPIAIEQDLAWYTDKVSHKSWSVVAHHLPPSGTEPTLKPYFFEEIRPIVERALQDRNRKDWPLITLNLDFKSEEPEHLKFIWRLLGEYESWLCTASRTADVERKPGALELRPVLVLTGSSDAQQRVFHDAVPVGGRLRLFGAVNLPNNKPMLNEVPSASNYRRWWNNPWSVVEDEGQPKAGDWTRADVGRLQSLVKAAHAKGLWIRFYTLNGHQETESLGWTRSYNFGSLAQARLRWQAAIDAGADFIATDQYEAFAALHPKSLAY
jgi:hypothetical protein